MKGLKALTIFVGLVVVSPILIDGQTTSDNTRMTEVDLPLVGILNFQPICEGYDTNGTADEVHVNCSLGQMMEYAMEKDDLLKVLGAEKGDLDCSTLDSAEEAPLLRFRISAAEVVIAQKQSYTFWSGTSFSDGTSRKVWTGEVVEEPGFEGIPRSISMAWSGCDVERFFLQIIFPSEDGKSVAMKSYPCQGSDGKKQLCLLEVVREGEDESYSVTIDHTTGGIQPKFDGASPPEESEAIEPPKTRGRRLRPNAPSEPDQAVGATSGALPTDLDDALCSSPRGKEKKNTAMGKLGIIRRLAREVEGGLLAAHEGDPDLRKKDDDLKLLNEFLFAGPEKIEVLHNQGFRQLSSNQVAMPSGRILQTEKTIDVLVLYTTKAMLETKDLNGPLRSEAQVETDIITAFEGTNDALKNSGIDINFNVVHMERTQFEESDDVGQDVYELFGGTGRASGVHELRDEYGADLVQMVGFYISTCGTGFTMHSPTAAFEKYAYSVVHTNCLQMFSHTHEIGHNLGANHDKDNSAANHGYAFGYRNCDRSPTFRTIMAYEMGCTYAPRVNIFSTPDMTYANRPQGTVTANNARALQEAATIVVNFRQPRGGGGPTPAPVRVSTPVPVQGPTDAPAPTQGPFTLPIGIPTQAPLPTVASIYPEAISGKWGKRKGCYQDDVRHRVMEAGTTMPAIDGVTIGMVRDNCLAYCYNKETLYEYYGVEYGHECFCGKNKKDYKRLGTLEGSSCDMPCGGDVTETCGGYKTIEVFEIKRLTSDESSSSSILLPSFKGCFEDTCFDVSMANIPVIDYKHANPESCETHCENAGYAYFALEFGFMCQCGDFLPPLMTEAGAEMCKTPCPDPSINRNCGGNWHMAVFSATDWGIPGDGEEDGSGGLQTPYLAPGEDEGGNDLVGVSGGNGGGQEEGEEGFEEQPEYFMESAFPSTTTDTMETFGYTAMLVTETEHTDDFPFVGGGNSG